MSLEQHQAEEQRRLDYNRGRADKLQEFHRQSLSKYLYYIIALCVASLAFTVTQTMGESLRWSQIPLLLAVVSFGGSIYCSTNYIMLEMKITKKNQNEFLASTGEREFGDYKFSDDKSKKDIQNYWREKILEREKEASWYINRFVPLFYAGVILFFVWRVVEMYLAIP